MTATPPAVAAPPSLLYVAPSAELYGSDLALARTARAQRERGGRACVVVPRDGPLVALLRSWDVAVRVLPLAVLQRRLMNPRGVAGLGVALARSLRPLARVAREVGADVVHSNTSSVAGGAAVARLLRLPHVWTLREDLGMPGGGVVAALLATGPGPIVAVGDAVRDALLRRRPGLAPRVRVILDGVDTERFADLPARDAARRRLGLDPGRPVVAMLARIKQWKGQTLLVEAVRRLGAAADEVQLLFAGDVFPGDEAHLDALRAAVDAAGMGDRVVLPGFLADPAEVLAAADVVAAPSTIPEPYGLSVVEALVAGRPVLASAHGGHLQTVRDGVDGLLVPAGDAAALAEALGRLLGDAELRRRLGEAGRRDRARFDAAAGHAALFALYDEVRRP